MAKFGYFHLILLITLYEVPQHIGGPPIILNEITLLYSYIVEYFGEQALIHPLFSFPKRGKMRRGGSIKLTVINTLANMYGGGLAKPLTVDEELL